MGSIVGSIIRKHKRFSALPGVAATLRGTITQFTTSLGLQEDLDLSRQFLVLRTDNQDQGLTIVQRIDINPLITARSKRHR